MGYKKIISRYANKSGGMIEAYQAVVKNANYVPEDAIVNAAKVFNISVAEAYGVASFYSMLSIEKRGRNIIRVCQSSPCHVAGAADIVYALENELGIKVGDSTPDNLFSLEFTECVGQCQSVPVITINGKPYMDIKPEDIPNIIAKYRKTQT